MSMQGEYDANPHAPGLKEAGMLASTDPVALDEACLGLVYAVKPGPGNNPRPLVERIEKLHGRHTVDYAEQIGLGTKAYEVVKI